MGNKDPDHNLKEVGRKPSASSPQVSEGWEPHAIKRELLEALLARKVTYKDTKRHCLTNEDLDYLYMRDSVTRREYVVLMINGGYSKTTAYRKWEGIYREYSGTFDVEDYIKMIAVFKEQGLDTARYEARLTSIPARLIFSDVRDYMVNFLGGVRDKLYKNRAVSTGEAAKNLRISPQYVRRLVKEGKMSRLNWNRITASRIVDYLGARILKESEVYLEMLSGLDKIKRTGGEEIELSKELMELFEKIKHSLSTLMRN